MDKYNKWLNSKGSIMYYWVFKTKDKDGSAIFVDAQVKNKEVNWYSISRNGATKNLVGSDSESNIIVTDKEELAILNKLPVKRDAIIWALSGKYSYNARDKDFI